MIFWRPTDFHHFHDWVGLLITLLTVALIALAIWAFQRLFPSAPKPLLILPFTLGFVATCAFVIGLNYGKDEVETMSGVMTGYSHARRASSGSTQGHYGVIEVKGMKIDVPLSVIEKKGLVIGDRATLLVHHGRFFDWGFVTRESPASARSAPDRPTRSPAGSPDPASR